MNPRLSIEEIASKIDHTLLKLDIDNKILDMFLSKGRKYKFRALVVSPSLIKYSKDKLYNTGIKLVSVIAFPLGQTYPETKLMEAETAISSGADELDIVLNPYLLKTGYLEEFNEEAYYILNSLRRKHPNITIKYILEVTILPKPILRKGLEIINKVQPDYFKTSTGYGPRGTSVDDIKFVKKHLSDEIKIKASGGIRTFKQFTEILNAGADIIGTSSGDRIIEEAIEKYPLEK